jgi:hypothetical protein
MKTMDFFNFNLPIIEFFSDVLDSTEENCPQTKRLIQIILGAHATNIFRFGSRCCAALAFAIQLKAKINSEIPSSYCAGIPSLQVAEIFGGDDFELGTFFL